MGFWGFFLEHSSTFLTTAFLKLNEKPQMSGWRINVLEFNTVENACENTIEFLRRPTKKSWMHAQSMMSHWRLE